MRTTGSARHGNAAIAAAGLSMAVVCFFLLAASPAAAAPLPVPMLAAGMMSVATATPAPTPTAAPNGWYWPTNHIVAAPAPGWLQYRPTQYAQDVAWHVAWDDILTRGAPVYSLGWGRVMISRMDVSGYGPGGTKGGAMVVRYQTTTGAYFDALYGHIVIDLKRVAVGTRVAPGQALATLNAYNPPHLHFGIHLGTGYAKPRTSTPESLKGTVSILMGHTYEYTKDASGTKVPYTYGFVDPVAFLLHHVPWVAPPKDLSRPLPGKSTVPMSVDFEATGTLAPAVKAGTRTVMMACEHMEGGKWVRRATFVGAAGTTSAGRTTYVTKARLTRKGSWRVRSYVVGGLDFPTAYSRWTRLTAR